MKNLILVLCVIVSLTGCGTRTEKAQKTVTPKENSHIVQGFKYLAQRDVPRAVQSFDLAIKNDPGNSQNYIVLGKVYMKLKNFSRAIDTFTAAVRANPSDGEVYQLLAVSLAARSQDAEDRGRAIIAAQKSVEIFLKNRDEENLRNAASLLKSLQEKFAAPKTEE